jgi:chaperonin GroES
MIDPKKLTPLGSRILCRRSKGADTSKGGILIPPSAVEKMLEATVEHAGEHAADLPVGSRIAFAKYSETVVSIVEGVEHVLVEYSDILGVYVEGESQ